MLLATVEMLTRLFLDLPIKLHVYSHSCAVELGGVADEITVKLKTMIVQHLKIVTSDLVVQLREVTMTMYYHFVEAERHLDSPL